MGFCAFMRLIAALNSVTLLKQFSVYIDSQEGLQLGKADDLGWLSQNGSSLLFQARFAVLPPAHSVTCTQYKVLQSFCSKYQTKIS